MEAISSFIRQVGSAGLPARMSALTGVHGMIGIFALLFVFLYGMSVGRTRAILSLLAIYAAYVLAVLFPYQEQIQHVLVHLPESTTRPAVFAIFYIAVAAILNISSLKNRLSLGELSFGKVLIVSFFQAGLLVGMLASLVPIRHTLPAALAPMYPYFASQQALFAWAVAALVVLPFIRGSGRHAD